MKKSVLLLLLLFIVTYSSLVFAQGINFSHGTFAEIKKKAKDEGKLIFLDFYTDWCGPCKKLDKEVFPLKKVGDFFNDNYVSYEVDAEKGEGIRLAKNFKVRAYPTLVYIDPNDPNENVLFTHVGYIQSSELIKTGKQARDTERNLMAMHKKFRDGNYDITFIKEYFTILKNAYLDVEDKLGAYIAGLKWEEREAEDVFNLINDYGFDCRKEPVKKLLSNYSFFVKSVGKERVNKKLYEVSMKGYLENLEGNRELKERLGWINVDFLDRMISEAEIIIHKRWNESDEFIKKSEKFISDYGPEDSSLFFKFGALGIHSNIKKLQPKSMEWMDKAIQLGDESSQIYYWYAKLYSSMEKPQQAIKMLKKGIVLGEKNGENISYLREYVTLLENNNNK